MAARLDFRPGSDTVLLNSAVLFSLTPPRLRLRGEWCDPVLVASGRGQGTDAVGPYNVTERRFAVGGVEVLRASIREYGQALAFEQHFPIGLNASGSGAADAPDGPVCTFPALRLSEELGARMAWRSFSGQYGSFTGVGLLPNDTLVFNGGATMPVLLMAPIGTAAAAAAAAAASVMVSPWNNFKNAAQAAAAAGPASLTEWTHGPSAQLRALPAGFRHGTFLHAGAGPSAAVESWGRSLRRLHSTNRTAAVAADRTLHTLGVWTDNGAYYNLNKWAGNELPGREWSPRRLGSPTAEQMLLSTLHTLRRAGVPIGYLQLDDWWCAELSAGIASRRSPLMISARSTYDLGEVHL
jgi:hypothetical protein